jgi:Flp pilus assembly protein TadG
MSTALQNVWRRFRRDERGNVFVLFGASAIPLLLIMGGAVDLARFARYKAELSNAVDSASLALARKKDFTDDQAKQFVKDYVAAFGIPDEMFAIDEDAYIVTPSEAGWSVTANASMQTLFLPLGKLTSAGTGIMEMDLTIAAEAVRASNRLELALVLDNTGSMNCVDTVSTCALNWSNPPADSRIKALKAAADDLVDTLMKDDLDDPDQIKIAVVPFEVMVNVASTGFDVDNPPNWIEWTDIGQAHYNGRNFEKYDVNSSPSTLERVGHKWLFNKLKADTGGTVKWGGCVEMRAGDYELSDDAPSPSIADSLFVPFFSPDEPDSSSPDNNPSNDSYSNDYLDDAINTSGTDEASKAQRHVQKYSSNSSINWQSSDIRTKSGYRANMPYEYGPNRGCPQPIVALTPGTAAGKTKVKDAIEDMIAYWSGGTYIPTGLIWGWHVLSPGVPYTEGLGEDDEDFENTVKAMVLLTDGDNQVQPGNHTHNRSNYSAYGYVRPFTSSTSPYNAAPYNSASRLDPVGSTPSATDAEATLDTKTAALCEDVKNEGDIRLYTITFGTLTQATKTMMQNCATLDEGERLYYHAPSSGDLDEIFEEIGEDLSKVHLSS